MSEPGSTDVDRGQGAGAMLRAAREQRGLHIAALAASMKVPQRKLEALESDRYDELPDLAFARALAQSVCRTLKIDAQPVLDRLPQLDVAAPKLQHVSTGLNAPFRERSSQDEDSDWSWLGRPVVWGTALVLIGAGLVAWMPERFLAPWRSASAPASSAPLVLPTTPVLPPPAASAPAAAPAEKVEGPAGPERAGENASGAPASLGSPAEATVPVAVATAATLPAAAALLAVKATATSWVEVQDARGQTLLSRNVEAGESVGLDGELPLRVTVGNASATRLTFRGKPVDLSANTVANVARLQLN
jgi:cytoskeleton protein RodZ